jgi:flavorubredoxin
MPVELRDGLWWLNECYEVGDAHEHVAVYCLEHEGSSVLLDSGSFHHREAILSGVEEVTEGAGPDALVLSHTDYPHSANVRPLRDRWGEYELVASSAAPRNQGLPPDARECTVGESLDVCGRELRFVDPPLADRSHTAWMYDPGTRTLFTADGFGARHEPGDCDATSADIGGVPAERVHEHHAGTLTWLQYADPDALCCAVDEVFADHDVELVAPIHGPPVVGADVADYRETFRRVVERIHAETDPANGVTLYGE